MPSLPTAEAGTGFSDPRAWGMQGWVDVCYVKATGRELNPQPVNRKSNALPLSHHATQLTRITLFISKDITFISKGTNTNVHSMVTNFNTHLTHLRGPIHFLSLGKHTGPLLYGLRVGWTPAHKERTNERTPILSKTYLTPIPWKTEHVLTTIGLHVNWKERTACNFNCLITTEKHTEQFNTLLVVFADNSSAVFCKTSMFLFPTAEHKNTQLKSHRQTDRQTDNQCKHYNVPWCMAYCTTAYELIHNSWSEHSTFTNLC